MNSLLLNYNLEKNLQLSENDRLNLRMLKLLNNTESAQVLKK